jgi:hypothetical protein
MKRLLISALFVSAAITFSSIAMEAGLTEEQYYTLVAEKASDREQEKNLKERKKVAESQRKLGHNETLQDPELFRRNYSADNAVSCCCCSCILLALVTACSCKLNFF